MDKTDFDAAFGILTGNPPFPWQRELYKLFAAGQFPATCSLPTGLGKTAIIPIWLIALAAAPAQVPRRLVYVVNRRTVVDQATREAEKVRENLAQSHQLTAALRKLCAIGSDHPLAISTLRGQFADNGEWRTDPARPAVIVGTVDLIGSRLLFQGYRAGFRSRPLYAGFLGQDVLLVHDEAHLEPAFQELLTAIQREQKRCMEFRRFHVVELSATSRGEGDSFRLSPADHENETVKKRIRAQKRMTLHPVDDRKMIADRIAQLALDHAESKQAILIFVRKVEDVTNIVKRLPKGSTAQLTGTLRGLERDALLSNPVFARFLPGAEAGSETVYLVCTSAGEVGVNISADHLVCDLTPLDSMAQRFGRVNRFGNGSAKIDVVHPAVFNEDNAYDIHCEKALELLERLNGDACPASLGEMMQSLTEEDRRAAFSPRPTILPTSDILFDSWALTTIREDLPGRPLVPPYLHGISELEAPETQVAWREEVERLAGIDLADSDLAELLSDYPLKPHELLRDRSDRVHKQLAELAEEHAERPVWLVDETGEVEKAVLGDLVQRRERVNYRVVVLPPAVGGLSAGMLDGSVEFSASVPYDVADEWRDDLGNQLRQRIWEDEPEPLGMRLVRVLDTRPSSEETEEEPDTARRYWRWYARPRAADDDGSQTAQQSIPLVAHLQDVETAATRIADALELPPQIHEALVVAARFHDLGKNRALWQWSIGNLDLKNPLAKSGGQRLRPEIKTRFRHEFGSLLDIQKEPAFKSLSAEIQDLVLHLIAAHHGRGRPFFPVDEAFDPGHTETAAAEQAREGPRRFDHLQRNFGRWGLAYLESLLRAADVEASTNPTGGNQ
jgi:CRISPR-associated endonuclease/helicase Cas3